MQKSAKMVLRGEDGGTKLKHKWRPGAGDAIMEPWIEGLTRVFMNIMQLYVATYHKSFV